jgi:molybdopterin converting factor small subunit
LTITVKVRTLGVFKELFGNKLLTIKLKKNGTVRSVVQKLADSLSNKTKGFIVDSEINNIWINALILVNGKEISVLNGLETAVSDGNEIVLLPVSHGG